MSHSPYLTVGDIWDSIRPYWRRLPRGLRWILILGTIVAIFVEPRLPFWIIGGAILGGGILLFKTPILTVISAHYFDSEKEKPVSLIVLDWGSKPFRLVESVADLLETVYEYLIEKK